VNEIWIRIIGTRYCVGDTPRPTFELSGWPTKLSASAPPRFFQSDEVTGWASFYLFLAPFSWKVARFDLLITRFFIKPLDINH